MDTTNNPFSSFETRLLIGAAAAAAAIVGGAIWYSQASASPATVAEAPAAPAEPAPESPAGPFMPDLVGMDVAEAQARLNALGIANTATDTCAVNGCHTAIVECNDGSGGWIDVRDTGAEKVGEQEFEPGTDLAGVVHVDVISFHYCPFGAYEHPVVDVEPEMPAEPREPVAEPAPTPTSEEPVIVEPEEDDSDDEDDDTAEEPVEEDEDDSADADDDDDDADDE